MTEVQGGSGCGNGGADCGGIGSHAGLHIIAGGEDWRVTRHEEFPAMNRQRQLSGACGFVSIPDGMLHARGRAGNSRRYGQVCQTMGILCICLA